MVRFDGIPMRVISMKTSEFDTVKNKMQKAGFKNTITHFDAVNGKEKADELRESGIVSIRALCEIEKVITREAHSSMPSWGGVGCYLSHETLWKEAADSKEGIIILEADADPTVNAFVKSTEAFNELQKHLNGLPSVLHIGFFFSIQNRVEKGLTKSVRVVSRLLGLSCYYISPDGAKQLLRHSRPIEVQVDSYMGYCYLLNSDTLKAYQMNTPEVPQKQTGTTIQLKRVEDQAGSSTPQTNKNDIFVAFLAGGIIVTTIGLCIWNNQRQIGHTSSSSKTHSAKANAR